MNQGIHWAYLVFLKHKWAVQNKEPIYAVFDGKYAWCWNVWDSFSARDKSSIAIWDNDE